MRLKQIISTRGENDNYGIGCYCQGKWLLTSSAGYSTCHSLRKPIFTQAKLINLNFQPPEVVARYRDPQLQVAQPANSSYLFIFRSKVLMSSSTFRSQKLWFDQLIKRIKNDYRRHPMLDQCLATVYDAGQTLIQHWVKADWGWKRLNQKTKITKNRWFYFGFLIWRYA